ncbi:MAG: WGR domain-containing protein [Deltaproteobacteria bacterium]|nr:WGR domain-containing protein [Deltaproteobacteria bacterium]
MHIRLEFTSGSSSKFWEIVLSGTSHSVTYGRIGASGQSKTKDFHSVDDARSSAEKLIAQKKKKGYEEVSAGSQGTKKAVTKKAVTKKAVTKKAVTKKAVTKKAVTKKAVTKKRR